MKSPTKFSDDILGIKDNLPLNKLSREIDSIPHGKVRMGIFALATLGGGALSLTSLIPTGHTISGIDGTTQSLLGIFLFVFGLVGLVFSFNRKKNEN